MKRILLAEDDAEYAALVREALAEAGCEVAIAPDGVAARRLAASDDYDLALIDLDMPRLGGLELARIMSRRGASVPLVALSGHDAPEVRSEAEAAGMCRFISKSSGMNELVGIVLETLGA